MVVDLPRRWRWAICVGCVAAIVLAVLFVLLASRAESASVAAPRERVKAAGAEAGDAGPAAQSEPFAAILSEPRAADEVQVCGGAWIKTKADGSFERADFERATGLPQVRERILARLRAGAPAPIPGDHATQDEALFRISRARRSSLGFFDVAGAILEATDADDASMLAVWALVTESIGIEAAVGLPAYQRLAVPCKGSALQDPNRAQVCAGIAEVLAERSDTLIERAMGTAIGKQVGWPAERSDRMRGEYMAFVAQAFPPPIEGNEFGCASIRRDLARVRHNVALGETGALRAWVASSGKTPDEFVRGEGARQLAARAAMEAAASAVKAASR